MLSELYHCCIPNVGR
ncbi:hypothetical protein CAEBREN_13124, partial [Caenorhabditis brenneri]